MSEGIRVIHGDCRELLPTLAGEPIAWVITDPPYGIGFVKGPSGRAARGGRSLRLKARPILGDDRPFDPSPFLHWPCVFFGANHFAQRLPETGSWHVWDKRAYSTLDDSFADLEFIWASVRTKSEIIEHLWKGVQRASENGIPRQHPSQKPLRVMRHLIEKFTKPGDLVLDPFAGSGSTLVACVQTGRRAIGVECDARYIDVIHRRLNAAATPLFDRDGAGVAP